MLAAVLFWIHLLSFFFFFGAIVVSVSAII